MRVSHSRLTKGGQLRLDHDAMNCVRLLHAVLLTGRLTGREERRPVPFLLLGIMRRHGRASMPIPSSRVGERKNWDQSLVDWSRVSLTWEVIHGWVLALKRWFAW